MHMPNLKKLILVGSSTIAVAMMALTGCQSSNTGHRTAGRVLDDRLITETVEEKLQAEPVYKFSDVDVKTFAGVVQLSGFVGSDEQKQRAGEVAQTVEGVTRVVNNITLIPGAHDLTPTGRTNDLDRPIPAGTRAD